jgi:beta-barrel assembly-enhancing protease
MATKVSLSRFKSAARRVLACQLCIALTLSSIVAAPAQVFAQASGINLPKLGDAADEDLPLSLERRIGEEIYRDYLASGSVLEDPEVQDYIWQVASRLTRTANANGYDFKFFIVRNPQINAFALPGGYIGIHTGLMAAAQSEAELASVLGHEIAHVTQRHIARMLSKQKQSSVLTLATVVLAALAARSNPEAAFGVLSLGDAIQTGSLLSFSRDAEREADRIGFDMLTQAGFDSSGMPAFFMRLQQANRLNESKAPEYARTHPITQERINDVQLRAKQTRYKQTADSTEYLFVRSKLQALSDESVDGLARSRTNFEVALRDRTTNSEIGSMYGLAYTAYLQRNYPLVEKTLTDLRKKLGGQHAALDSLNVEALIGARLYDKALENVQAARLRFPQSRALTQSYAKVLLQLKQFEVARRFLEDQTSLNRGDHQLLALLAKAYDGLGLTAQAHKASSERYELLGSLQEAINQLEVAQKSASPDFYLASQIDAKLRELRQTFLRERAERNRK